MKRILVVLPTFNEVGNLMNVYSRIKSCIQCDILIIDDGSKDGTRDVILDLQERDKTVHSLLRDKKYGLGKTYLTGYRYGIAHKYDALIQLDADGSHEIEKIPLMVQFFEKGFKMVTGSRYVSGGDISGWSQSRVLISKVGNFYGRVMLSLVQKDVTSGFRLYDVKTLATMELGNVKAKGYSFQIQMSYIFREMPNAEIPIKFVDRIHGKSKMGYKIIFEALYQIPLIRILAHLESRQKKKLHGEN